MTAFGKVDGTMTFECFFVYRLFLTLCCVHCLVYILTLAVLVLTCHLCTLPRMANRISVLGINNYIFYYCVVLEFCRAIYTVQMT